MAKTNVNDIDRNIYDIKNKDEYEFKMQKGLNKEIVEIRTNDNIKDLNNKIEKMCDNNKCTYINMYDDLTDKNGNMKRIYTVDGLHLNKIGYKVVTNKLIKYLDE